MSASETTQFSADRTLARTPAPLRTRTRWQDANWIGKPVSSAHWGIETLEDGRLHCWIEHELVEGVTPTMLAWWFRNMEGTMEYQGHRVERYRVWHPRDHIAVRYAKRCANGEVGVGSVLHIREMLGGDPRYAIDTLSEIHRLDEGGFEHRPTWNGMTIGRMVYCFEHAREGAVEGAVEGTRYRNSLTIGIEGALGRLINPLIRRFVFDTARAKAWIKHNIEEVGQFENFLPELYATEREKELRSVM
jgi:DAPG hydrolase PhiG domain